MKYIRKFNESKLEASNDPKYLMGVKILQDIFAEMIDDESIDIKIYIKSAWAQYDSLIIVDINTKSDLNKFETSEIDEEGVSISKERNLSPSDLISKYERLLEISKDLEVCYKRSIDELTSKGGSCIVRISTRGNDNIRLHFNIVEAKF